jgi:hypothetical protein
MNYRNRRDRWLPALAEALTINDVVRYPKAPKVISAGNKDPFDAPGTQGVIVGFSNSSTAQVQFQTTTDGVVQYSIPLTVLAGQRGFASEWPAAHESVRLPLNSPRAPIVGLPPGYPDDPR